MTVGGKPTAVKDERSKWLWPFTANTQPSNQTFVNGTKWKQDIKGQMKNLCEHRACGWCDFSQVDRLL